MTLLQDLKVGTKYNLQVKPLPIYQANSRVENFAISFILLMLGIFYNQEDKSLPGISYNTSKSKINVI